MRKKHKKVFKVLNYIEHSLAIISAITGRASISAFASLVGILIGITTLVIGLKICVIVARIKNCKSRNRKNKRNHDKIVLLAKSKLNSIEVLIYKDSNIIHDEFVLINNLLKEFYDMKEEIKNSNNK